MQETHSPDTCIVAARLRLHIVVAGQCEAKAYDIAQFPHNLQVYHRANVPQPCCILCQYCDGYLGGAQERHCPFCQFPCLRYHRVCSEREEHARLAEHVDMLAHFLAEHLQRIVLVLEALLQLHHVAAELLARGTAFQIAIVSHNAVGKEVSSRSLNIHQSFRIRYLLNANYPYTPSFIL